MVDDHRYYNGASSIESYLKNVFIEKNGKVIVNPTSSLRSISYTDGLTLINFASAFSSYNEYIIRNNKTMNADVARQKELAIEFFNTVDYTASGYNDIMVGDIGMESGSMAHCVVALGSLMGQKDTERFAILIEAAYENYDANFWDDNYGKPIGYNRGFYQLCADYDWFDESKLPAVTTLTDENILEYYGYGINLAKDYPTLWSAWVTNALSNNAISTAEAKAFAYHYAYQMTQGDVDLGVYGNSRAIVSFE